MSSGSVVNKEGPFRVLFEVAGAPVETRTPSYRFVAGELTPASDDDAPADLTMTVGKQDWLSICEGSLPMAVAYMHGRLKPEGDPWLVLLVLSCGTRPQAA